MHGGRSGAEGGGEPLAGPACPAEPGSGSSVLADLRQLQVLADRVMAAPLWQHSSADAVAAVRESAIAARKVQAVHLTTIADLDSRPGVLPGAPRGSETRAYLQAALHRTKAQAKLDVAAAHALQPDADPSQRGLSRLGQAFANGEVSREHVDAAVRAVRTIPRGLLAAELADDDGAPILDDDGRPMCAGDVIDDRIARHAQDHDSYALSQLAYQLKDVLDPDGSFDPDNCTRRSVRTWWDHGRMFHVRGQFDTATGAFLEAAIDLLADPRRGEAEDEDGSRTDVRDGRSTQQRKADAVAELARAAVASGLLGTRGGEAPRVTVITRLEDLIAARAAGHPRGDAFGDSPGRPLRPPSGPGGDGGYLGTGAHIDPLLLERLACDSVLQRVLLDPAGAILDLGREVRTVSPAQRRALAARDRGCVIPGCTAPAAWCEGHHVQWWRHGGRTDIDNLALLCSRHHTEVHCGMWTLFLRDGVPWVVPPDWIDPEQRPLRNLYSDRLQEIRDLAAQLTLKPAARQPDSGGTRASPPGPPRQ